MKDVAIVSYCRTAIAKAQRGALNQTHGIAMAAPVMKQAVARATIDAGEIEDVVLGCGLPEGATGHNVARNAALHAGFGRWRRDAKRWSAGFCSPRPGRRDDWPQRSHDRRHRRSERPDTCDA